jgi:hypothetical protein
MDAGTEPMEVTAVKRNRMRPRSLFTAALLGVVLGPVCLAPPAPCQSAILYQNDFETPNVPIEQQCAALDFRGINFLYGTPQNQFYQQFTVEAVSIQDGAGLYSNPSGIGGSHAIGMLSSLEDDGLALTFDTQGQPFINVTMDVSSIDIPACGGPVGVADPIYRITLVDSPGGVFAFGTGTVLDQQDIAGVVGPTPFTFAWTHHVVALDTSGSADGTVTVVWDLLQSGYAVLDNLHIEASNTPGGCRADAVPPDVSGVPADETAECDAVPAEPTGVVATDNCDPAPQLSLAQRRVDGTCPESYRLERTWLAQDSRGNQATRTQTVTVVDTFPPGVLGALVPAPPLPPASPVSVVARCSPPVKSRFRVECAAADACDPAPALDAVLRLTSTEVPHRNGPCLPVVEEVPVACGEVVEVELLEAPCPARRPHSAKISVSVNSAGIRVLRAEQVEIEVRGEDACGNLASVALDPTRDAPPVCAERLPDGTCCPLLGRPEASCGGPSCQLAPSIVTSRGAAAAPGAGAGRMRR